ncbi:MAG: carbonic anhydrase [Thermoanaerobaculia bacterium]
MHRSIRSSLLVLLFALPAAAQTSGALWDSLMEGNRTFVAGKVSFDNLAELRHESAAHQNPPVTVLSCADSRVPPELVFDRSIDQLFVVRVAGNVAGPFDLASIEYAIANGYTKLIVVLGHEECGAVRAALTATDPSTPSLVTLVQRIRESFTGIEVWTLDPATVRRAVEANARGSAAYLIAHSSVIRDAVQSGRVGLVVAYYNLGSGVVERIAR